MAMMNIKEIVSNVLSANKKYTDTKVEDYVNTRFSNIKIEQITQENFEALATKDPNTLYLIVG